MSTDDTKYCEHAAHMYVKIPICWIRHAVKRPYAEIISDYLGNWSDAILGHFIRV